jgi:uncharacterized integral membrane protein
MSKHQPQPLPMTQEGVCRQGMHWLLLERLVYKRLIKVAELSDVSSSFAIEHRTLSLHALGVLHIGFNLVEVQVLVRSQLFCYSLISYNFLTSLYAKMLNGLAQNTQINRRRIAHHETV